MACDPCWNNTVLALHFDGTNGSTTFTDEKGKTITANGNAQISTAQSKFGGASGYFDGTGDYLSVPSSGSVFNVASLDFTISFWCRPAAIGALQALVDFRGASTDTCAALLVLITTGGNLSFRAAQNNVGSGDTSWEVNITGATALATGTWYHVSVVRYGLSIKIYLDGVSDGSATYSGAIGNAHASNILIGSGCNGSGTVGYHYNGYIDDLQVTVGVARHTANFTPPTTAFVTNQCAISGVARDGSNNIAQKLIRLYRRDTGALIGATLSDATTGEYGIETSHTGEHFVIEHDATGDPHWGSVSLLMHMDDTGLSDEKGNPIALYGNTARSATQSKFGGYSAYFDGSGDYLTGPTISLGSRPFTVEFWYYPISRGTFSAIMADADYPFAIYHGTSVNSGNPSFSCGPSNSAWFSNANNLSFGSVTNNVWVHIAVVRIGDTFKLFKDGTQVASGSTDSAGQAIADFTLTLCNNNGNYVSCYIDDLRITAGVARYTANFTPSASAFPSAPSGGSENADILDLLTPV